MARPFKISDPVLGNRLKELREEHDYSLAQMANILDCDKTTVKRYERTGRIDVEVLRIYCEEFNISPSELLDASISSDIYTSTSTDDALVYEGEDMRKRFYELWDRKGDEVWEWVTRSFPVDKK